MPVFLYPRQAPSRPAPRKPEDRPPRPPAPARPAPALNAVQRAALAYQAPRFLGPFRPRFPF